MTDDEMDAAYVERLVTREARPGTPEHNHECGHKCYWNCHPGDRLCFNCEIRIQDEREPRNSRGMNRRRVG